MTSPADRVDQLRRERAERDYVPARQASKPRPRLGRVERWLVECSAPERRERDEPQGCRCLGEAHWPRKTNPECPRHGQSKEKA